MSITDDLYTYLLTVSGVTNLVQDRIYPLVRNQKEPLPCIVFQDISDPRVHSHDGVSGLANPRIQFSCWAAKAHGWEDAQAVAEALRVALDCYHSGNIQATFLVNELSDMDPETGDFRKLQEYEFWYGE